MIENEADSDLIANRDQMKATVRRLQQSSSELSGLLGAEGSSAELYWRGIRHLLPNDLDFDSRTGRGATDIVNCALNYGYAIINSRCLKALYVAGLDPYCGFFHQDRPGRTGLSLDFMELFRAPVVDAAVLKLARRQQLSPISHDEPWLSKDTRYLIVDEISQKLDKKTSANGMKLTLNGVISTQAQEMARSFASKEPCDFWRWRP